MSFIWENMWICFYSINLMTVNDIWYEGFRNSLWCSTSNFYQSLIYHSLYIGKLEIGYTDKATIGVEKYQ